MISLYHLAVLINISKWTLQAAVTQTRKREQVINLLYCLSLNSRIWFKNFFLFYKALGQNTLCPEDLMLLEDGRQHIVLISITVTLDGISLTCVADNNQRFRYSFTEKTYFTFKALHRCDKYNCASLWNAEWRRFENVRKLLLLFTF